MLDHELRSGPGVSRRDFLKGSGAAAAATAVVTTAREAAAQKPRANLVSAKATDITLNVNGKDHKVNVEPRVTLLDVLRNRLDLTGGKEVCDTTNCGACTVLIDGKATFACARFAVECAGKKIQTVESLTAGKKVDAVVAGFVKHDAMQCGFCTPGFVMATRAFLDKNPKAKQAEIQKGLGGNICRCGTYAGITACAMEIAKGGA
jgi:aerobic-type carbon monoxide dehydrogenase small subunit (CoxS/CutS family)